MFSSVYSETSVAAAICPTADFTADATNTTTARLWKRIICCKSDGRGIACARFNRNLCVGVYKSKFLCHFQESRFISKNLLACKKNSKKEKNISRSLFIVVLNDYTRQNAHVQVQCWFYFADDINFIVLWAVSGINEKYFMKEKKRFLRAETDLFSFHYHWKRAVSHITSKKSTDLVVGYRWSWNLIADRQILSVKNHTNSTCVEIALKWWLI